MNPAKRALLWASDNQLLKRHVPDLPLANRAVRRFMPGEELDDALDAAQGLQDRAMPTIITRLGENLVDLSDATGVTEHYKRALDAIAARGLHTEISVKLTQLGLDLDTDATARNLDELIAHAGQSNNWVWIDMEQSRYVDVTLDLYRGARGRHRNIGVCLQSYLRRTADDLMDLLPLAPAIRLVKGAYLEPASVAFPKKADVDASFLALSGIMLEHAEDGLRAAFASHDMRLIERVQQRAARAGVPADAYEIQMLYGIRTRQQTRLAAGDGTLRVLISYGPDWYPWYVRRLAERPANLLFVLKNLF